MRLGINAKRLTRQRTGVGRYIFNLIKQWNEMPLPFEQIILYTFQELDDSIPELSDSFYNQVINSKLPTIIVENLVLSKKLKDIDLLFCPSNMIPVGYKGRCVVTIHDVLQEAYPHTFEWWARYRYTPFFRYSAKHADRILTVSESSKRDICKYLNVAQDKVKIIYLAADKIFRPIKDKNLLLQIKEKFSLESAPFFLFVGKLSKRRNIPNLLKAFGELKVQYKIPHKLMIIGLNHLNLNIYEMMEELGIRESINYVEYVSDEDLVLLYNAADVFIYPSKYEGFGLPNLEAMACGTPVITLDNSAITEVTHDAALLLQSGSVEELKEAMYAVITDSNLKQTLSLKGLERSKSFSWEKTAKETLSVLETVMKE